MINLDRKEFFNELRVIKIRKILYRNRINLIIGITFMFIFIFYKIEIKSFLISLFSAISKFDTDYAGVLNLFGSIIGGMLGFLSSLIFWHMEKLKKIKNEKKILADSLTEIYSHVYYINLNQNYSLEQKISALKYAPIFAYNKECKNYVNYIRDNRVRNSIKQWILMCDNSIHECIYAIDEMEPDLQKALEDLGYKYNLIEARANEKEEYLYWKNFRISHGIYD